MSKKHYVIMAAVSEDGHRLVLLTKNRGPEHLIGKLTFPGGHVDPTDASSAEAARRELAEETGVVLPLSAFESIGRDENELRIVDAYLAFGDISTARTVEDEAVCSVAIDGVLSLKESLRPAYADDFFPRLEAMMPRIREARAAYEARPTSGPYLLPYQRPDYRDSLDRSRPRELLDEDLKGPTRLAPNKRRYLKYRYTDNGETVLVPNVPYNVTPQMRADDLRFQAGLKEEKAAAMLKKPPEDWTPWMAEQVAERLQGNARRMRDHAERIERGEVDVLASWEHQSEDAPSRAADADAARARRLKP